MTVVRSALPRYFLPDLVPRDRVRTFVLCRKHARHRSRFYLHSPLLLSLPLSFRFSEWALPLLTAYPLPQYFDPF